MTMLFLKIKEVFTFHRVSKALTHVSIYTLLFIVLELSVMHKVYLNTYTDYETKLNNIVKIEGLDINLMCNVVDCTYVKYNNEIYYNNKGFLETSEMDIDVDIIVSTINDEFETLLTVNGVTFLIKNDKFINLTTSILFASTLIFLLFATIIYISKMITEYKSSKIEKSGYKMELESKLQRDMTESLHHEIGNPIAIISTLVEDLYRHLYPCKVTEDGVCDFKNEHIDISNCKGCTTYNNNRSVDAVAADYYYKILFSLDKLSSIQNIIGGSKHIKYSNGTVAIFEIIKNIVDSNNSYKITKINGIYKDVDMFNYYACGYGLANGDLLLVLHNMVTNSIEAKSTEITFRVESISKHGDVMKLLIEDNGRGVRNALGDVIKNKDIFNYGYSTKDTKGEAVKLTSLYKRILFKLGLGNEMSSRGAGLSVNVGLLERSGGSIELVDTSVSGTTFRVTIPIKLRKV